MYARTLLNYRDLIESLRDEKTKFIGILEPIMVMSQKFTQKGIEMATHPLAHLNTTEEEYYIHKDSIVFISKLDITKDLERIIDGSRDFMKTARSGLVLPPSGGSIVQGGFGK
jgi:hypothetical protein